MLVRVCNAYWHLFVQSQKDLLSSPQGGSTFNFQSVGVSLAGSSLRTLAHFDLFPAFDSAQADSYCYYGL